MDADKPIREESAWAPGIRLSGSDRRRLKLGDVETGGALVTLSPDGPVDPTSLFERPGPVELEVGCGKGAFLVMAAETWPGVNFLGVEIATPFAAATAERVARRGLSNVKVACADAHRLVTRQLPAESLQAVHVFFPDPWPKKKHRKRRIFSEGFLDGIDRILIPGGRLCLASDFIEYWQSMQSLVDGDGRFEPLVAYTWHGDGGVTNFERKYLREGRSSHRAAWRKRSPEQDWSRL